MLGSSWTERTIALLSVEAQQSSACWLAPGNGLLDLEPERVVVRRRAVSQGVSISHQSVLMTGARQATSGRTCV